MYYLCEREKKNAISIYNIYLVFAFAFSQFWFFVTFWFLIFVFEMQDVRKFAIATNCTTFRYICIYIYMCMCLYICGCIHVCVCWCVYIWVEFIYNLCKFSLKIKFSLSKYAKRMYIEINGKYASRRYDSRLVDTSYASVNSIVNCNYPIAYRVCQINK